MARSFYTGLASGGFPSEAGTQDYVSPDFEGTPVGAVVWILGRGFTDSTFQENLSYAVGLIDSDAELFGIGCIAPDFATSHRARSYSPEIAGITPMGVEDEETFLAAIVDTALFIAGGVRLTFSYLEDRAKLLQWDVRVLLFGGEETSCELKQARVSAAGSQSIATANPAHTLFVVEGGFTDVEDPNEGQPDIQVSLGFAARDSSGAVTQGSAQLFVPDEQVIGRAITGIYSERVGAATKKSDKGLPARGYSAQIDNWTDSGFDLVGANLGADVGTLGINLAILTISHGGDSVVLQRDSELSKGPQLVNTLGFLPGLLIFLLSEAEFLATYQEKGALFVGVDTFSSKINFGLTSQNGVTPSNTSVWLSSAETGRLYTDGQDPIILQFNAIQRNTSGFSINWLEIEADAELPFLVLAIEDSPFVGSSDGFFVDSPRMSGVGSLAFTGTAALEVPAPEVSADADQIFAGSGGAVASVPAVAGIGALQATGQGALLAATPLLAAEGAVVDAAEGQADLRVPAAEGQGEASLVFVGGGDLFCRAPAVIGNALFGIEPVFSVAELAASRETILKLEAAEARNVSLEGSLLFVRSFLANSQQQANLSAIHSRVVALGATIG